MQLFHLRLTPTDLRALSNRERALLVVLGHAVNDVNTFDKLAYLSSKALGAPRWQDLATAYQMLALARVLVGKLYEGWEAVRSGYFDARLSRTYASLLDDPTKTSLDRLKKYFGRKSLLSMVRNEFAFHYSVDHAATEVPDEADGDDLSIYLHERPGNCFYQASEYLMSVALFEKIDAASPDEALSVLLNELRVVCRDFNEFVLGITHSILSNRLGEPRLDALTGVRLASGVPTTERKKLPYFIRLP